MSLRDTNPEKWQDPWFSDLNLEEKILFLFLCDSCDIAGFYERNDKATAFYTGIPIERLNDCFLKISKSVVIRGRWVFVKNFIRHQNNFPLNPDNNCHRSIINRLTAKNDSFSDIYAEIGIDLSSPSLATAQPLARGYGKGKGKSKSKEGGVGETKIEPGDETPFEVFWATYPRKVGKGAAEKIWGRIPDVKSLFPKIMGSLSAQVKCDQWKKDAGQFIPHPATWLNQKRWEDETAIVTYKPSPEFTEELAKQMKEKNEAIKRAADRDFERRKQSAEEYKSAVKKEQLAPVFEELKMEVI